MWVLPGWALEQRGQGRLAGVGCGLGFQVQGGEGSDRLALLPGGPSHVR